MNGQNEMGVSGEVRLALSRDCCESLRVVPLRSDGRTLFAASAEPLQLPQFDRLEREWRGPVETVRASDEWFAAEFPRHLAFVSAVEDAASENEGALAELTGLIFSWACGEGASDIHFEPSSGDARIRFRVDGRLRLVSFIPRRLHENLLSRLKLTSGLDIAERRRPQDGRLSVTVGQSAVDVRISTLSTLWGEKLTARLLTSAGGLTIGRLGGGEAVGRALRALTSLSSGLVLSTGPTGSGKTTTQYALLKEIDRDSFNVLTVEDPIEYRLPGVNQVQINEAAGATFSSVLKAMLRQDPDVIMVGEIRDPQTAQLATRAALTGHLVFSTLHTADAASALWRLIEIGVPVWLVAASVKAVVAQRLLRLLCPHCRRQSASSACWTPVGCPSCGGTGYRGRTAIFEILEMDDAVRHLVMGPDGLTEVRRLLARRGVKPLRDQALELASQGLVTMEDALLSTPDGQ